MSAYDDNYETLLKLMYEGEIPVTKYKSKKTGLKICICETEGPIVQGFLTFATEAHDDDGLPHTLEHLTFMGSELYPYKGVLDLLANRCLASGTNASTAVDYTDYTMSTVGTEGFLNLLPIYMDHVLYPLLTNEAFLTEVHHINGEGEDAGVVYCEMQACENNGDNLCYFETNKAMYPGRCGYKSETGGRLKNLRESTTNEKIREYHSQFYRPENLCIIIIGKINASDVFKALAPLEERIIQKGPLPEFVQPWKSPVPPLNESVEKTVPYPCDDCEHGIVTVAWRGPLVNEIEECTAIELLLEYLCNTSVSPLQRDFIEIDEPYCSDVIASLVENSQTVINIDFESVSKESLYAIKPRLLDILLKLANGEEEFDMNRISIIIHNSKLNILNEIEKNSCYMLFRTIIADFLYGETTSELELRMQGIQMHNKLAEKDAQFWQNILKKYFLVENIVTIIGEPSPELKEKMIKEEKSRISKQRETLGEEGLKLKEESLQEAKKKNKIKPPKELLQSMSIPSVDTIKFHSIRRLCNYKEDPISNEVLKDIPCSFQLDDINTKFVTMWVIMDTSILPLKLRFYLPLYTNLIMELPIERNGKLISHKEIVTQLEADTLEKSISVGLYGSSVFSCGPFSQLLTLNLKVEEEKYEKGIMWLYELLYKTKFTTDRIQVLVNKMLKKIAKYKRYGGSIVNCLKNNLTFTEKSNFWPCNMLRQNTFLKKIQKLLETDPNNVINDLEELRRKLTEPENILVHMMANLKNLKEDSLSSWKNFIENPKKKSFSRHKLMDCKEYLALPSSISYSCIVGVGSVESSYLVQSTRCIDSCKHPDYPALIILISYLSQVEGPFWCVIRGTGLSYNYDLMLCEDSGLIHFTLAQCTAMVAAYKEAKKCIDDILSGRVPWDQSLLESSRSCLIYETVEENESSVPMVSFQSLLAYYRDIDMNFTRNLLKQIYKVTIDDLQYVGTKYLIPLFDPTTSSCAICCHTSKVEEIVTGFKEIGRNLTVIKDLDDCIFSHLEDENILKEC